MTHFNISDVEVEIPHFGDGRIHHIGATWDGANVVVYIDGERQ